MEREYYRESDRLRAASTRVFISRINGSVGPQLQRVLDGLAELFGSTRAPTVDELTPLYTEEDFGSLHMIASCMKTSGSEAPEWMLKLPRKHGGQAKKYVPPKRKNIMDNVGQAGKKQKKGNSRK